MPKLNGRGKGDLLVKVRVEVPRTLTPKQKELLKELAVTMGVDVEASGCASFAGAEMSFVVAVASFGAAEPLPEAVAWPPGGVRRGAGVFE